MDEPRAATGDCRWWREPHWMLLVLVVAAIYFSRLTVLTIRNEESRRARVAVEMIESGDWIVPTQQGQIYLSRPPLGSYPIAWVGLLRGKVDAVAARLPTVTAVLLTCVLIYGYARGFLSAAGGLAAGLAYSTMGQVMEIGRKAESEGTFTLLVAASLLLWHAGYVRRWPSWLTWSLGYALAALAGLTKGPQGPVYFVAVSWTYMTWRGEWKELLGRSHAVGLGVFLLVLGSWQVPYLLATNLECSLGIWLHNAADRFENNSRPNTLLAHMATYPLEMFVCLLPWSLWLPHYLNRQFRTAVVPATDYIAFLVLAVAVTFPTVWLAGTAKTRYFMPLYPCLALLIGVLVERCLVAAPDSELRRVWRTFTASVGGGLLLLAFLAVAASALVHVVGWPAVGELSGGGLTPVITAFAPAPWIAATYAALILCGTWTALALAQRASGTGPVASLVLVSAMLGLTFTGIVLDSQVRHANDPAPAIAQLKRQLPVEKPLVSFGRIDHLFAYHYESPVEYHPIPKRKDRVPDDVEYFVVNGSPDPEVQLPFSWEHITTISLDRNQHRDPRRTVIVGRRLPEDASGPLSRSAQLSHPSTK